MFVKTAQKKPKASFSQCASPRLEKVAVLVCLSMRKIKLCASVLFHPNRHFFVAAAASTLILAESEENEPVVPGKSTCVQGFGPSQIRQVCVCLVFGGVCA